MSASAISVFVNCIIRSLLLVTLSSSSVSFSSAFDPLPAIFPVRTRQALVEKSQRLNAPILQPDPAKLSSSTDDSNNNRYYQYGTAGWSNRAATVLTPQAPGVWTADRPFYWNNIDVGCRCTVLELPPSSSKNNKDDRPDLWIHSPVALDGPMKQACESLGRVKYVVSPNYEHVSFVKGWSQVYSKDDDVQMWACPGLMERMPDISWTGEIPHGYRPNGWKGPVPSTTSTAGTTTMLGWDESIIQPLHVNIEKNPFTGRPFFNEVVYYHTPSKTLMVTDVFWNYPRDTVPNSQYGRDDAWELAPESVPEVPLGSRLWKFGMDQIYGPFYNTFMVTDPAEYRAIANHIVNEWDVEMLIPAHGDILRGKEFIRDVLTKHFQL